MDLEPEEIEALNAYGPYNHAVWQGRGVTLSHEESISGRAQFLVNLIRDVLTRSFSRQEMETLTLVDVGCYDGWVLDQLADLPFKKFVGIEPRARNIEKGNTVRSILKLNSRAEFRVGSIEALGSEVFDVVICLGLLHHLESVGDALRALRSICGRTLVIETLCLSASKTSREISREIEPKDIIYFGKAPVIGLCGYKFESSYYHGSAIRPSIVAVPNVPIIKMFLEFLGFQNVKVLVPPSAYWLGERVSRNAKACCLVAELAPVTKVFFESAVIKDYERAMLEVLLPTSLVQRLYERFCEEKSSAGGKFWEKLVVAYVGGPSWPTRPLLRLISRHWHDPFQREIIKNLRYAPADKSALEMAKVRFAAGDFAGSIGAAMRVSHHLNADWRSTYRAFLIIARAYQRMGDEGMATRYFNLCRVSNPELPEELLDGKEAHH